MPPSSHTHQVHFLKKKSQSIMILRTGTLTFENLCTVEGPRASEFRSDQTFSRRL